MTTRSGGAPGDMVPGLCVVLARGVLSTLLTGFAGGSLSGLAEDLVDKGVPEPEAAHSDRAFRAGQAVVAMRAVNRAERIAAVLRRGGEPPPGTGERPAVSCAARRWGVGRLVLGAARERRGGAGPFVGVGCPDAGVV